MPTEEAATPRQMRGRAEEFGAELLVLLEDVPRPEWSLAAEVELHREAQAWEQPLTRMDGREWTLDELEALLAEQGFDAMFVRDDSIRSIAAGPTRERLGKGWDGRRWTWHLSLQLPEEASPDLRAIDEDLVQHLTDALLERGWHRPVDDSRRSQWTLWTHDVGGLWLMRISYGSRSHLSFLIHSPEIFDER